MWFGAGSRFWGHFFGGFWGLLHRDLQSSCWKPRYGGWGKELSEAGQGAQFFRQGDIQGTCNTHCITDLRGQGFKKQQPFVFQPRATRKQHWEEGGRGRIITARHIMLDGPMVVFLKNPVRQGGDQSKTTVAPTCWFQGLSDCEHEPVLYSRHARRSMIYVEPILRNVDMVIINPPPFFKRRLNNKAPLNKRGFHFYFGVSVFHSFIFLFFPFFSFLSLSSPLLPPLLSFTFPLLLLYFALLFLYFPFLFLCFCFTSLYFSFTFL